MEKRVILIIKDGWGYRKEKKENAIAQANTRNNDFFIKKYPNTLLKCSGDAVGLPRGYQGNSEVGHMTLGAGRIIFQSLERINSSIRTGEFFKIPEFLEAIENCKKNNTSLHLIGLLQKQGVHSHLNHLFALIDLCVKSNFKDVCIHAITDGRDAPKNEGKKNLNLLSKKLKKVGFGKIVTLIGRYYALDRDKRWERTKTAYDCIVYGKAKQEYLNPLVEIKSKYKNGETDEFIVPSILKGYTGIKEKDSIIFFNFRTDRPRQLTRALIEKDFEGWDRKPLDIFFVAMTQYYNPMNGKVAFKEQEIKNLLGEVISNKNLKQLRISETEKYAHVTFFFNGQKETPFRNEKRILIPSPKVLTYDLKPEMSAYKIKDTLIREIKKEKYEFVVVNFVNCDMVGHTGNFEAIKKAVEVVDYCVGETTREALKLNYDVLITADHGNAEDQRKDYQTTHTKNPVQFILVSNKDYLKKAKLKKGKGLKDVAPTILYLLGIEKPSDMTGENLIN